MALATRRLTKNKLWIFAATITLGALMLFLEAQGVYTSHSGDMICGGSATCYGYFNFTVPTKVTNSLGELTNITSLCFGSSMNVILTNPEKVSGLGLYKADRRYSANNPARWKKFNFTGSCIPAGLNEFMINATKDVYSTVKWAIEGTNIDPLWKGEQANEPGFIGDIIPSEEIRIESQTYIDQYFNFNFTKINETMWLGEITINKDFLADLKNAMPYASSNTRWTDLKNKYFSSYAKTKVVADLKNITAYPLKAITSGIEFSGLNFNLTEGKAAFYIEFLDGFKENEKAALGFGTTQISTIGSNGCYANGKCICRTTDGHIHVAWRDGTTSIKYGNSSDEGLTWTTKALSDGYSSSDTRYEPSISCDGNNVTIAYEDNNQDRLIIAISINSGGSFSYVVPFAATVSCNAGYGCIVDRRGQNIYAIYANSTTGTSSCIFLDKSTDGGSNWANSTVGCNQRYYQAMAVNGTGTETDAIYINTYENVAQGSKFENSTDAGATWTEVASAGATTNTPHSNTFYNNWIWHGKAGGGYIYYSTNYGASWSTWTVTITGTETDASVYLNALNNVSMIADTPAYYTGSDVVMVRRTASGFNTELYLTNDSDADVRLSSKQFYGNGREEFIWKRSSTKIMYGYITGDGSPNIPGFPWIVAPVYKLTNNVNCSAVYNGADSGRVDFIWYVNGTIQNYNGSSANVNDLTKVYTNVTLPNTTFVKSNSIICSVRAYNGSTYSDWLNSSAITVSNSAPTIVNQQSYVNGTNAFNVTSTAADADGLTDISSCAAFYKLDDSKQVDDLVVFNNNTNITGTYTSANGNCTVIIGTSDNGQLRFGKNYTTSTQSNFHSLVVDSNYIFTTADSGGVIPTYKLDINNGTVLNSSGASGTRIGLSENTKWLFTASQPRRINKTDFSTTTYAGTGTIQDTVASDTYLFTGDDAYNLTKWDPDAMTLVASSDFGTGTFASLFYNETSDIIYTGDKSTNVKKINASNFADVKWSTALGSGRFVYSVAESYVAADSRDFVWAGDDLDVLSILNDDTGVLNRSNDYGAGTIGDILSDDNYVYFAHTNGYVVALNKTQARVNNNFTATWTIYFGMIVSGIDMQGDYLYVMSSDMRVWKVNKNSGTVIAVGDEVVTQTKFIDASGASVVTTGNSNIMPGGGADNPPTFSSYNANTTVAGSPVNFSVVISDDVSLSGYIFETNNTGTWNNYTWIALASGGTAYNITTLNSTVGKVVNVSFYANDSIGNWSVYRASLTTSAGGDTCDCSSIQVGTSINCAENCDIGACNVGGIAVTFINTGTITTSGDVTNILRTTWSPGCAVVIGSGKKWG